jgi:hypothetical protein
VPRACAWLDSAVGEPSVATSVSALVRLELRGATSSPLLALWLALATGRELAALSGLQHAHLSATTPYSLRAAPEARRCSWQ